MRHLIFLLIIVWNFTISQLNAQDSLKVFFNEVQLSLNHRPPLLDQQDTWGFGGGLYHVFKNRKHLHWVAGVAYNYTQIFDSYQYNSHYSHYENLLFKVSYVSLPLSARLVVGKKVQAFLEPGVFVDFRLGGRYTGTYVNYAPDSNNMFVYKYSAVSGISYFSPVNPGISLAFGGSFPIQKNRLSVKAEYKIGLLPIYKYFDSVINVYYRLTLAYNW